MSRKLTFYGASFDRRFMMLSPSDDLFPIIGTTDSEPDEEGCFDRPAVAKVESSEGVLCVVGMYAPEGVGHCWCIGLMPIGEGVPIPEWPMEWKLSGDCEYSAALTITAPDDAVVSMLSD